MAGELAVFVWDGADALYWLLFQPGAPPKVRDVVHDEWDDLLVDDLEDYVIAAAESPAGTGRYLADWPADVPAGNYWVQARLQFGVAPAWSDEILYQGHVRYDGTQLQPPARAGDVMQIDLAQVNVSSNDPTELGGQVRRIHALAGGTVANKDYAVNPPTIAHRDETDSDDLIVRTLSVDEDVETDTPT